MDIDIKAKQIPAEEQKVVLRTLAESAARQGCKFLEIGSWYGDSTIILGNVAKKYGGYLFCVDWWKGNVGIDLEEIASRVDVFSYFWNRIRSEGLEDVVIPIRGRSDIASEILKTNVFDLVFIDGDHRYEGVLKDIQQYAPLVRDKGILCGHDCEGHISDYDMNFLESGKDVDYYESVHCGVVLAVGSIFKNYSINYSIWSVQANGQGNGWEPANLVYPGVVNKRQLPPPPIGFSKNYLLHRFGRLIYAVPRSLTNFDVTEEINHPEIIVAETKLAVEDLIGEKVSYSSPPELLESYKGYNIVKYDGRIYALSASLGPIDISQIEESKLKEYQESGKSVIGNSIGEIKNTIDLLVPPIPELVEEGYNGFNIVLYRGKFYGMSLSLGPLDMTQIEENVLKGYQDTGKCIIANSLYEAKYYVDRLFYQISQKDISESVETIKRLNKEISDRDELMGALQVNISERDETIRRLNKEISDRDERMGALQANISESVDTIRRLNKGMSERDMNINALQKELADIKSTKWNRLIAWSKRIKR